MSLWKETESAFTKYQLPAERMPLGPTQWIELLKDGPLIGHDQSIQSINQQDNWFSACPLFGWWEGWGSQWCAWVTRFVLDAVCVGSSVCFWCRLRGGLFGRQVDSKTVLDCLYVVPLPISRFLS